jgi:hypothetical protein
MPRNADFMLEIVHCLRWVYIWFSRCFGLWLSFHLQVICYPCTDRFHIIFYFKTSGNSWDQTWNILNSRLVFKLLDQYKNLLIARVTSTTINAVGANNSSRWCCLRRAYSDDPLSYNRLEEEFQDWPTNSWEISYLKLVSLFTYYSWTRVPTRLHHTSCRQPCGLKGGIPYEISRDRRS